MLRNNILITGGAGYIGSCVAKELLTKLENVRLIIVDNLETGSLKAIKALEKIASETNNELVFRLLNLEFIESVFEAYRIDSIFHLAGSLSVEESVKDPIKYFYNNTANSIKLIKLAELNGVKNFIFSSTATVYKTSQEPLKENALKEPANAYGHSKLMIEQVLAYSKLKHVILRYFNVAGASLSGSTPLGSFSKNSTHLIKTAAELATNKRKEMFLYGTDYDTKDGTCVRDYIHIEDLANAHLESYIYLEEGNPSNVMNCGYEKGFSVKEVIDSMEKVSNRNLKVIIENRRPGDIDTLVADNTKLLVLTSWNPKFNDIDLITKSAYLWELIID